MAKKKLVKKYSINTLFIGAMVLTPALAVNTNAQTVGESSQINEETWKRVGAEEKYTGEMDQANSMYKVETYGKFKSNLGNTKDVIEQVTNTYYDSKGFVAKEEYYAFDEGKLMSKMTFNYVQNGEDSQMANMISYAYDENGKASLQDKLYLSNYIDGSPRKMKSYVYNLAGEVVTYTEYKLGADYKLESSYEKKYTNGVVTETLDTSYYGEKYDDIQKVVNDLLNNQGVKEQTIITEYYKTGEVKSESNITYLADGKTKKEIKTTEFTTKGIKTKDIYNTFNPNGTKKLARDTYYYPNGKAVKQIRQNQYNSNGIKTKNVINDFYSSGKKKLARDTYYYANGKTIKEIRQNQYNVNNKKTKYVLNTFHTNGKKKLARDTYYYEDGSTRKTVKQNQYASDGKRTKAIVNEWDNKGQAKLYQDTYYKTNGKVKEVRKSTFSNTGKKTTTNKKY